jgi:hypothetical protein
LLEDSHMSLWDDHGHGIAARRACDAVARAGGSEGSLDHALLPNVELEVATLGRGESGSGKAESKSGKAESKSGKAESKSGGRQRDAHDPIVAWVARLGQCSGMTP